MAKRQTPSPAATPAAEDQPKAPPMPPGVSADLRPEGPLECPFTKPPRRTLKATMGDGKPRAAKNQRT